jgi:hypothetical protein
VVRPVTVSEGDTPGELVIATGDAIVRIRASSGDDGPRTHATRSSDRVVVARRTARPSAGRRISC